MNCVIISLIECDYSLFIEAIQCAVLTNNLAFCKLIETISNYVKCLVTQFPSIYIFVRANHCILN